MEVREYVTADGGTPLIEWLDALRDGNARARILARLDRLRAGLLGDWKSAGEVFVNCGWTTVPATACTTDRMAIR